MTTKRTVNGKQGITFLSIDPGCRHTGWSECLVTPDKKIRVIKHGVFEHDYSPEENAKFLDSMIKSHHVVLVENPPIIRVNAATSHSLAKIYGAMLGVIAISTSKHFEPIAPRVWQRSILKDHYNKAKQNKKKIDSKEKEMLIEGLVNKNITRRKLILNPHVIDTIAMVIYFCEKYNGTVFEEITYKEIKQTKETRKKNGAKRKKTSPRRKTTRKR